MGAFPGLVSIVSLTMFLSALGTIAPRGCDHRASLPATESFARVAIVSHLKDTAPAHTTACERSESVGRPWNGSLACGHLLPDHPRMSAASAVHYGTRETMHHLGAAADFMDELDPDGPPVEVLDISKEGGGPFPGHLSHQSGRDVDVSYFYRDGFEPGGTYIEVPLEHLDMLRTWFFLRGLIRTGRVKTILIDHDIQALLYEKARELGVCNLGGIFQYPREPGVRRGLIRHHPNHRHHMHIRFRCPKGDKRCRG